MPEPTEPRKYRQRRNQDVFCANGCCWNPEEFAAFLASLPKRPPREHSRRQRPPRFSDTEGKAHA